MTKAQDWKLDGLTMLSQNNGFQINIKKINIPFINDELNEVYFYCPSSTQLYPQIYCKAGAVSFLHKNDKFSYDFTGWINLAEQTWDIKLKNKSHNLSLITQSSNPDSLIIQLENMTTNELSEITDSFIDSGVKDISANITAQIKIDFKSNISAFVDYQINNINWESDDGNYVLSKSRMKGTCDLKLLNGKILLTLLNDITQGEGLLKNIYLQFSESKISTHFQLAFDNEFNLTENNLKLNIGEENQFNAHISDLINGDIAIDFKIFDLLDFKTKVLDAYLEILGINDLDIIGQAVGKVNIEKYTLSSFSIDAKDISLEIESKKIQAQDLNAELSWANKGPMQSSHVKWKNLLLAGMPVNESEINFSSAAEKIQIEADTNIPIFDGNLIVHQLFLDKIFDSQMDIVFDGEVAPISLALITEKMGWPIMQGSISGKIPGMNKRGQSISFDGSLDLNLFDGSMRIDNLSIERLLGIAPVIAADISFQDLNLQQITSTFDFGKITGLVEGYVDGLRITNWKAERLDAHVNSVPSKEFKQTISQKAIDNISSIGGIQGALSRSFLRFFDSFKYKKIGIGCKLRNSICEMSGIKTSDNTYKLIEGKGIPSINIIGFQKFIDWEVFLDRLLNAGY